jgi:transcription initiation factor IIE alpha subunit
MTPDKNLTSAVANSHYGLSFGGTFAEDLPVGARFTLYQIILNAPCTTQELTTRTAASRRSIKRHLRQLKDVNAVRFVQKNDHWGATKYWFPQYDTVGDLLVNHWRDVRDEKQQPDLWTATTPDNADR